MMRKAGIEDIRLIKGMAEIAFRETYKLILSEEQVDYMMDWMYSEDSLRRQMLEENTFFFIEEGRGYASFKFDRLSDGGLNVFHIEKLYVLPEFQRTGLGESLFHRVVDEAREAVSGQPFRIELNVNRSNPAVSFYEHMGMHRDREGDFPIGRGFYMNDFIMAIDL